MALYRADGGRGPLPAGALPATWMRLLRLARQWGVPPWVIAGEEPTRETVARWARRGFLMLDMEG